MTAIQNPNHTVVDGVEHLVLRDGTTKPLFRFAFGLEGPDRSLTSGWTYLPTLQDQLRYLGEHKMTKPDTVYKPVILLQLLEDIYVDGHGLGMPVAGYTTVMEYPIQWSHLDEEALANGNHVSRMLTGTPPRGEQLERRPMHGFFGDDLKQVGRCLMEDCLNILDGKADSDAAICTECMTATFG